MSYDDRNILQRNTVRYCVQIYFNQAVVFFYSIPPPNFMHAYDKMIPASKGDGPSYSMLSI